MTTQQVETNPAAEKSASPMEQVRGLLMKMKPQLQMALPKQLSVDRFIRVAITCCQKTPKLMECHPITLIGAMVQAAQLGLELDDGTGKAYLIPFNNNQKKRMEVQLIIGYKGLAQLARNSGDVKEIEARVVHKNDKFVYRFGLNPVLDHEPCSDKEPGEATHFYAVGRFKDGGAQFDVMTKAEVDRIRARAPGKNSDAWRFDYDEMGKKTVVRRISKLLPASAELHTAVNLDEKAELSIPQDLGILVDPTETTTPEAEKEPAAMPERISEWSHVKAPKDGICGTCREPVVKDQDVVFSSKSGTRCLNCDPTVGPPVA